MWGYLYELDILCRWSSLSRRFLRLLSGLHITTVTQYINVSRPGYPSKTSYPSIQLNKQNISLWISIIEPNSGISPKVKDVNEKDKKYIAKSGKLVAITVGIQAHPPPSFRWCTMNHESLLSKSPVSLQLSVKGKRPWNFSTTFSWSLFNLPHKEPQSGLAPKVKAFNEKIQQVKSQAGSSVSLIVTIQANPPPQMRFVLYLMIHTRLFYLRWSSCLTEYYETNEIISNPNVSSDYSHAIIMWKSHE